MRINTFLLMSWVAAAVSVASPARAQAVLVIDDFKEGADGGVQTNNHPTWETKYKTGANTSIAGGVRQTNLTVSQGVPAFGQETHWQIGDGALVVSGGYKSYFAMVLGYGYNETGGLGALDLDLSGVGMECYRCDSFRIEFDGSDSELGYLMEVYDKNGNVGVYNGTESLAGRIDPSHVDFPRDGFGENPGYPVDWHHIAFVFVLFQTGTTLGGHDLALTKISFMERDQ